MHAVGVMGMAEAMADVGREAHGRDGRLKPRRHASCLGVGARVEHQAGRQAPAPACLAGCACFKPILSTRFTAPIAHTLHRARWQA